MQCSFEMMAAPVTPPDDDAAETTEKEFPSAEELFGSAGDSLGFSSGQGHSYDDSDAKALKRVILEVVAVV